MPRGLKDLGAQGPNLSEESGEQGKRNRVGWGGCSLETHEEQHFQLYFEMIILGVCRD